MTLILRCQCGVETLDIDMSIEPEDEGYLTFATWWDQHRAWSERLRVCWAILRGKSHYFDAIILNRTDLERVQAYLESYLKSRRHDVDTNRS